MFSYSNPFSIDHSFSLSTARLSQHELEFPEIKDPSVVHLPDGTYLMYASIGSSIDQKWKVGRFQATHPSGPWQEISPVKFEGIAGPQLCAPAVRFDDGLWTMYVQTTCFEENGCIAIAHSTDGENFYNAGFPLITTQQLQTSYPHIVGVYDAGISEINLGNSPLLCLLFSGYRKVGCGDLYLTYRPKHGSEQDWSPAIRILSQEDVPFHNHPDSHDFEWGLEGAQIIQLPGVGFLLVGVCFLPKPHQYLGTRQRVFFAFAKDLLGPYIPLSTPIQPSQYGENGHPDAFVINQTLWMIYQERHGKDFPWHLRATKFDLDYLASYLTGSPHPLMRSLPSTLPPDLISPASNISLS